MGKPKDLNSPIFLLFYENRKCKEVQRKMKNYKEYVKPIVLGGAVLAINGQWISGAVLVAIGSIVVIIIL